MHRTIHNIHSSVILHRIMGPTTILKLDSSSWATRFSILDTLEPIYYTELKKKYQTSYWFVEYATSEDSERH